MHFEHAVNDCYVFERGVLTYFYEAFYKVILIYLTWSISKLEYYIQSCLLYPSNTIVYNNRVNNNCQKQIRKYFVALHYIGTRLNTEYNDNF